MPAKKHPAVKRLDMPAVRDLEISLEKAIFKVRTQFEEPADARVIGVSAKRPSLDYYDNR